jgi:hypothetical protein
MNKLDVFTVRINDEIVTVEGINDNYTVLSGVKIPQENLDKEALAFLDDNYLVEFYGSDCVLSENEAKDLVFEAGNLKVSIEVVTISFTK